MIRELLLAMFAVSVYGVGVSVAYLGGYSHGHQAGVYDAAGQSANRVAELEAVEAYHDEHRAADRKRRGYDQ